MLFRIYWSFELNNTEFEPKKNYEKYHFFYSTNMAHAINGATAHTSNIPASGIIQANPNLTLNGETYHLSNASSPAVDAALVLTEVTKDFDGQSRDPLPDIGCDELSNTPILLLPLTMGDVGPCWTNGTGCSPLPVELINFEGIVIDKMVRLSWITTSGVDDYGFEIEHSTGAIAWNKIAFLASYNDMSLTTKYTYNHATPSDKTNYYRLKQIDLDGTHAYSETICLSASTTPQIQLSPNPTTGIIHLSNLKDSKVQMTLIDMFGRKLKHEKVMSQIINISLQANGYYFIRIESAGKITTYLILKN